MSNYGIAVSADGFDVKTCDDKDLVITSKYNALKGSISGSGSVSVPQTAATQTVTIPHGLSYIPMVQAYALDRNGDYFDQKWFELPVITFIVGAEVFWQARADSTNVYLRFSYDDFGFGGSNVTVDYKYFIFIDKGNLQ